MFNLFADPFSTAWAIWATLVSAGAAAWVIHHKLSSRKVPVKSTFLMTIAACVLVAIAEKGGTPFMMGIPLGFFVYKLAYWVKEDPFEHPWFASLGFMTTMMVAICLGLYTFLSLTSAIAMNLYRPLTLAGMCLAGIIALQFVLYGLLRLTPAIGGHIRERWFRLKDNIAKITGW